MSANAKVAAAKAAKAPAAKAPAAKKTAVTTTGRCQRRAIEYQFTGAQMGDALPLRELPPLFIGGRHLRRRQAEQFSYSRASPRSTSPRRALGYFCSGRGSPAAYAGARYRARCISTAIGD
jgi:hypothetical protein